MATGTIRTVADRGFGFIRPDGEGEAISFHRSALVGLTFERVRQGDRATSSVEPRPRGRGAERVGRRVEGLRRGHGE